MLSGLVSNSLEPRPSRFWARARRCCCGSVVRAPQVALYGEECDPWPTVPGHFQWADINLSLKFCLGADLNGAVFRDAMPCLTTKSVLLMRVLTEDGARHWRRAALPQSRGAARVR